MSFDSQEKQAAFAKAQQVRFPMIGDANAEIASAFGASRLGGWLPDKRVTFVIDKQGKIRRVIQAELDIDHHIKEATAALHDLEQ